ncbi:MAG: response regulator receiver protein [Solirubrobacterales bacterium]|nr:response regulator receiver protein [Solirubrobacterales bacterium]
MICIAVLDDHPAVRAGLEAILAPQADLQLVGFAAGEHELWALLERTRPTVVVLDLHHPGRDGLALSLQIKRQPDPPAVVLYSAYTPADLMVAAAVAGADATVSKSSDAATLVEAIRAVARNPRTIPPITPRMKADAAARLDPADHAILAMRVAGDSPVEIAATLGVPDAAIARRIAAIVAALEPIRSAA